jgi:hypothetical protein
MTGNRQGALISVGDFADFHTARLIPVGRVPLSEFDIQFILRRILAFEAKKRVDVIHGILHDFLHVVFGQAQETGLAVAGGAKPSGVKIFNRAVAESQGDDGFRLSCQLFSVRFGIHGEAPANCACCDACRQYNGKTKTEQELRQKSKTCVFVSRQRIRHVTQPVTSTARRALMLASIAFSSNLTVSAPLMAVLNHFFTFFRHY